MDITVVTSPPGAVDRPAVRDIVTMIRICTSVVRHDSYKLACGWRPTALFLYMDEFVSDDRLFLFGRNSRDHMADGRLTGLGAAWVS